jgi:phospholipid/cholesterol/gamma-HCH transport system substrate-binding protein
MSILRDDDARFRGLSRKIGFFVIVAVAAIALTVLAIGIKQEAFTARTDFFFVSETARDLALGTPVKLSGFTIGRVKKIELTEKADVRVVITINNDYLRWMREGTQARLQKEGLIGNAVLDIEPGEGKPLAENARIEFQRERGLTQVVDELRGEIVPILQDVKRIVRYVENPQGDVKQMIHRANELFGALQGTQKKIDRLLDAANAELPATLRRGREAVEGGKKVVDSLQRTWPIRGNIEPPKPALLPMDSYEARPGAAPPAGKKP